MRKESYRFTPGPGTYSLETRAKSSYKPVIVECFFKGADKCCLCDELLFGDYYKDSRKVRPLCWCLSCYRFAHPNFTQTYLANIKKHRHCQFVHKHIQVKNIVYHLIPQSRIRALFLKEKSMWAKYGELKDSFGRPV